MSVVIQAMWILLPYIERWVTIDVVLPVGVVIDNSGYDRMPLATVNEHEHSDTDLGSHERSTAGKRQCKLE